MFCIASKEVTSSALLTIQAAKEVFREKFGVELASRLGDGTLDGHPGLHEAAEVELTGLRVHRCLEHAKRNIGKHGRLWVAGNKTSMLQGMMEATAFFPSALLFHATWLRIYQRLGGIGTEGGAAEPGMTKYMQKHQVVVGSDGLLTAAWRTSLLEVQPGYAGYVQNYSGKFWTPWRLRLRRSAISKKSSPNSRNIRSLGASANASKMRLHSPVDRTCWSQACSEGAGS